MSADDVRPFERRTDPYVVLPPAQGAEDLAARKLAKKYKHLFCQRCLRLGSQCSCALTDGTGAPE